MSDVMVIIGAGHAAVRAALAMREAGHTGPVVMIAAEGVDLPYERPPLSKWSGHEPVIRKPVVPLEQWDEAQIERIEATVTGINTSVKSVLLDNGTTQPYSRLLLATGASARRLPEALAGKSRVHYLRDAADALSIRQAADTASCATIIGGGFIGLELAASLRGVGVAVHVVEAAERLLERAVSAPVSKVVHELHSQHGVQFSFDAVVADISTQAGTVRLADQTLLETDLVVAGVGSVPAMDIAQSAGLDVSDGICVDSHLRSSDPDVFAAGDCCVFPLYGTGGQTTRLESWQAAGDQGALAGLNMVTEEAARYTNVPWFWSEHYDHVLQVAGLPAADMTFVQRSYADNHHVTFGITTNGTLGYACGIAPGLKIAKDIRFAMKIIESARVVSNEALADPDTALKSLR